MRREGQGCGRGTGVGKVVLRETLLEPLPSAPTQIHARVGAYVGDIIRSYQLNGSLTDQEESWDVVQEQVRHPGANAHLPFLSPGGGKGLWV